MAANILSGMVPLASEAEGFFTFRDSAISPTVAHPFSNSMLRTASI